ncbi:acetyl-CoA acetyltransferase [Thiopseudomonas alkaliphila]|uniref:acetyl-CoA C-acyltransferase n=1 Tax=Thiopseudomonas alkaliphila TaxID=1697053 RepID=UPI00069CC51F|nr:acetyl-CoA C-acyltransferase [Thiopseudomonas alkaliphila]AKX49879.1 acetyl-CoA acetyltransferase [Thiopseudomonas alkaliphila]AKX54201.1 acetyl-CoA acetyltransferase [Thiopseudomonas alkaliphila]
MHDDPVVIVSMARTPMGGFQGELKDKTAPELGAAAIKGAVERAQLDPNAIEEVMFGCVLPAGLGQAPARQAALGAGLNKHTVCTTVNKMCGSGMQTVIMAHDALLAGSVKVIVAGGMESMSNAPYLLDKARAGYRMGHGKVIDHMFLDGLEDAYDKGRLMGTFAEDSAQAYGFSRQEQDDFAIQSLERAQQAMQQRVFSDEIVAVEVAQRKQTVTISEDEQPPKADVSKIRQLRPAFSKDGTVTAANSSSISDGAAALVLMRESEAKQRGLTPMAAIRGHSAYAAEPHLFTTAPVGAINKLMQRTGWSLDQVDLFEINEAFAVVTMIAMRELDLAADKVNIRGGACALGHPIGASGARIIVTLLSALKQQNKRYGVASLCIGGGEATALAVELLN